MDTQSNVFRSDLTRSLTDAYKSAFGRAKAIFFKQGSPNANLNQNPLVNIVDVVRTSRTNPENTKNEVNVKYYVTNNNALVQPEFAADSINLLNDQEFAQYLKQEVVDQGYIESNPRPANNEDKRLWIIAAVLGPLAFLIVLFWLIAFIYYKCINPRRPLIKSLKTTQAQRLKESPHSVFFLYQFKLKINLCVNLLLNLSHVKMFK